MRADGDPRGRLGLWEESGALCLEAAVRRGTLVLRGNQGELWPDGDGAEPQALVTSALPLWRGRIASVERGRSTVVRFTASARKLFLRAAG